MNTQKRSQTNNNPLPLLAAALILPGLALSAAALNLQWGARPSGQDALPLTWWYVNLALAANTFLLYPAAALRTTSQKCSTWLQVFALILAAIPALSLAAYLSQTPLPTLAQTLILQLLFLAAVALLLARRWTTPLAQSLVAGTLSTLFLVLPIVVYFQAEFLPALPRYWSMFVPLIALHRVAPGA